MKLCGSKLMVVYFSGITKTMFKNKVICSASFGVRECVSETVHDLVSHTFLA